MLLTSPCDAQYMYAKIPPYDISNGLPHNGINDIVLDNEGYAWIATENGISRYDGYHFVNFNSTTNPGIFKDNRIVEIKKNGDILYLMTEADGLIEFKPSQLKFRKLSNEKPISISIANDTTAFLFGNGSLVLKKKDLIIFNKIFNVSDAASVLIYQGDILLSANQFEIFRIHLSEFNRIEKLSMQNPAWSSGDLMLSKKYGVVNWNGWRVFALKNNEFIEHPEFLGQVRVSFFEEENSGDVLWIDKFRIPVLQINHSNLAIHFAEEENIQYRCICRINETSFLIGTNQGLVQMCQTPDLSKRILDYPLIKYNEPIVRRRIIEHENKRYYLGFPYIVEENEKKELSHLSNTVLSTYDGVIFNNKLFCTTEGSGLVSFDLKTKKIVTHTNHILGAKDELNDISVFSDSLLLLTSFNKIISYNPKNKTGHSFSLENDNNIYVAAQIETGPFILLGTSKGLYRIKYSNENGFEFIENTLSEIKQIKDILIRQNANEIWLATDNGVATLRLDDFSIQKIYSSENEVSHPKVTALIEDLNGNIWASTYSGLTVYNTHDGSIKFLNKPQGIINHEFNYKSACALQNGQLAFGGLNAFEIIDPQKLSDFHYNNNFRIAGIQRIISDTRKEFLNYTNGETISFQTGSESVVIQLANLDYQYGVGYNFKYTIDGRNWFEADQNQQIILSDLSYGDYTLSIRMFDPFGNVVDEQIFPINARAPFYVKTEFHILFASLSILILALVAYSFMRSIRIRTVTKAKIAMDLHDESGTILTRLLLISNKEKFGTKEKAQIQNGLKEALFSFRTYLDSISNKKHSLQDLSDDLKEFIQSACGESEIHFDYKILFDKNYRLNRELYRDVKLSVYEVITNCLKHAHANFISLEINAKDKKLVLIICDNGTCKLENLSALNGNGIRNIINRAKRNSGTVKHFIEEGTTGLTTQITLPIV
jgi:two-component sensor histidine kinase